MEQYVLIEDSICCQTLVEYPYSEKLHVRVFDVSCSVMFVVCVSCYFVWCLLCSHDVCSHDACGLPVASARGKNAHVAPNPYLS